MTRTASVAQAKAKLPELLREIESTGEPIVIERRGKPVAVIRAYDPALDAERPRHWVACLDGIVAGVPDFGKVMKEVVASRARTRPRPVVLEDRLED